jgi:hypothetical protein
MNCCAASQSHRHRASHIGRFRRLLDSMNVTAVLVIRPTRHFALAQRDRTGESALFVAHGGSRYFSVDCQDKWRR